MTDVKICQSCEMPMTDENLFGENEDRTKNEDYCVYCYKDGKFNSPDETMEEMIECCVQHCLNQGVYDDAEVARRAMQESFPKLKRWKK